MSIQDLLTNVRTTEKPNLQKFRENFDPAGFKPHMFEVKFTTLPGATEEQIERLSFLTNATKIPSIGGWNKDWYIQVLMDLELYDLFRTWAASNFEAKGAATILLYRQDGSLLKEYPINNLIINEVSAVDLDWGAPQDEHPSFQVYFKVTESEFGTVVE